MKLQLLFIIHVKTKNVEKHELGEFRNYRVVLIRLYVKKAPLLQIIVLDPLLQTIVLDRIEG